MNKNLLITGAVIIGTVFLAIALVYFSKPADMLPSFFPGYEVGLTKIHYKHGLASIILSAGAFIFAWFKSGPKSSK